MASFRLLIHRSTEPLPRLRATLRNDELTILCPPDTHFPDPATQAAIQQILRNIFRHEAKRLLPVRLAELATHHNFAYTSVRITSSRTRWGSCTQRRTINLSLYLMRLPWHLIDYVLLHELCHTREMNHGPRFWTQLNSVTANQAHALRHELRNY
jgi:predicted metal-dependent hydrolase